MLCIDCDHYVSVCAFGEDRCNSHFDPVRGLPSRVCKIERESNADNRCGCDAKWFIKKVALPVKKDGFFKRLFGKK